MSIANPNPLPITLETAVDHLSNSQREAMSVLIAGQGLKSAAQAAGVHRTTVYRWLTSDALFRAIYYAWQEEARESAKVKLLSIASDALNAVTAAIQRGDEKIGYKLLKDLGLLTKINPGHTDPELLDQQMQVERASAKRTLSDMIAELNRPSDPK